MIKKMSVIVFLVICSHQQSAMLRPTLHLLQSGCNRFTNKFLKLTSSQHPPLAEVCLVSQVPLDKKMENKIFQLAVEDDLPISILLTKKVVDKQYQMFVDMQKEGCTVGILPENYKALGWKEEYTENNDEFDHLEIVDPTKRKSFMMMALISYCDHLYFSSDTNAALFGGDNQLFYMQDHLQEFKKLKQRFTELVAQSND